MIGTRLAHYRITDRLGAGGMGEVYLADDDELGRRVAIKFLPVGCAGDALDRFKREAQATAALNHPNIIAIHDVGTHEGRPYLVMEYVDGEPLSKVIERKDLAVEQALEIATQIFEALSTVHEAGVVHRDIKPDNILIDRRGRVRILDFGLAMLHGSAAITADGSTLGTVHYMSPEQTLGSAVDGRSDLFSAGVVLYEMLAGRRPFVGEHPAAVLYAIANEEPQPLRRYNHRVSEGVERLVENLLAKDPQERYPSAAAVLVDIRREHRVRGRAPASPWRRRWIAASAGAVVMVAAGVWFVDHRRSPHPGGAETSSIAVLPLINMSPEDDQEYFSDGLTEELMNVLVKIPELRVAGRTSSFSFKGKTDDVRTIGEKLGVEHILDGSVRKSGDQIRITARLVKAADGFQLWSQTYERRLDDIFAVQNDIAQ